MNTSQYWYKSAIFYELYVRAFKDSNADGWGDLKGVTEKLDYLQDLGVDAIWLLPISPSPLRDDGYDVSDYYGSTILPTSTTGSSAPAAATRIPARATGTYGATPTSATKKPALSSWIPKNPTGPLIPCASSFIGTVFSRINPI